MILAFDVRVERDAQELADSLGVKVFTADIIYHLFDNFLKHRAVCTSPHLVPRATSLGMRPLDLQLCVCGGVGVGVGECVCGCGCWGRDLANQIYVFLLATFYSLQVS